MKNEPVQLSKAALREGKHRRQDFPTIQRNPIYIVLDNVRSAHNVGCIFRMADAVLASKIFVCGNSRMPEGRKFRKGSRGVEKWIPWSYQETVTDAITQLKNDGVEIISIEICDLSVNYTAVDYTKPVCFVIGSETYGVSPDALRLSDRCIHLPMLGMSNSLNVSTATCVVLYDWLRKAGD